MRDRGIDIQSLFGNAPTLLGRDHAQGTHVVQTVCDLDQDHSNIAGHGEQHFPKVFGLCFFTIAKLDRLKFG